MFLCCKCEVPHKLSSVILCLRQLCTFLLGTLSVSVPVWGRVGALAEAPFLLRIQSDQRLLLLLYSVHHQHSKFPDTFSACWVILAFP